jgi:hypothetical protein
MPRKLLRYGKNAGWLIVPVLLWNAFLTSRLPQAYSPEVFWSNIPAALSTAENALRLIVTALPFFSPLEIVAQSQKRGLAIFSAGLAIYFISWLPLIYAPDSAWSLSAIGFLAPAGTPAVWLFGLALVMQRLFWRSPYRWWVFLILSLGFLAAHISHAAIVFGRVSHANGG